MRELFESLDHGSIIQSYKTIRLTRQGQIITVRKGTYAYYKDTVELKNAKYPMIIKCFVFEHDGQMVETQLDYLMWAENWHVPRGGP